MADERPRRLAAAARARRRSRRRGSTRRAARARAGARAAEPRPGDRRAPAVRRSRAPRGRAAAQRRSAHLRRSSLGIVGARAAAALARHAASCSRCRARSPPGSLGAQGRRRLERGETAAGRRARPRAALWLGRVGVIAGVAAMVVFVVLHRRRLRLRGVPRRPRSASSTSAASARTAAASGATASAREPARGSAANLRLRWPDRPLVTPNPFIKQYLMTAGPTPGAARRLAGDGRADALPPRAGLRRAVRARARAPAARLPHRATPCSRSPRAARARWSRPSPTSCARARRRSPAPPGKFGERWIQLCEAYGADLVRHEPGWGERLDPADDRPAAEREPRRRGRVRHAERDLDRHRARHPGDRRGRPPPRRAARRRRRLRPRRRASCEQDEWGVDVVVAGSQKALMTPPGLAFASVSERALEAARAQAAAAATTSTGAARPRARRKGASPFTPAVSLFLGLDVALEHDRGGGPRGRLGPPRPARPRHARRRRRARPRAVRRPGRALDRRDRDRAARATSTAARSPARCASSASPPTAARTTSRAGSCASPTAATSARSTSSPRSRAWRWRSTQLGHDVEHGAGVGAAQRVFLEAGVLAAA